MKLDLVFCDALTSLPERLGDCQQLKELNLLSCSALTSLPERLGDFQQLKVLILARCGALTSLPARLGDRKQLSMLNLYDCSALTSLPDLSSLPNLDVQFVRSASEAAQEWKKGGYKRYPPPPSQ
jgi:hypothetical protein